MTTNLQWMLFGWHQGQGINSKDKEEKDEEEKCTGRS